MEAKKEKQAVLLIHGVGEQKPMETLRPFVKSISVYLNKTSKYKKRSVIWNKSDKCSVDYETRVLRLRGTKNRLVTDFYECYWANFMNDNNLTHFYKWLLKMMVTPYSKVPQKFSSIWRVIWCSIIGLIIIVFLLCFIPQGDNSTKTIASALLSATILPIIIYMIKKKFYNYVGDAGRYFTPIPDNLENRYKIRKKGIEMLDYLQQNYNRVIIIGHGLGSVIGYDLLRFSWVNYHEFDTFAQAKKSDKQYLRQINNHAKDKNSVNNIDEFQHAQYMCSQEYAKIGMKWKITDFVTIGSPLCDFEYFLPKNYDLNTLVNEREYPICPPIHDDKKGIYYMRTVIQNQQKLTYRCLHRAALFAVTRWTNIYYKNDIIGGEIPKSIGKGIKEVEIENKVCWWQLGGQTDYWNLSNDEKGIKAICEVLRLTNK